MATTSDPRRHGRERRAPVATGRAPAGGRLRAATGRLLRDTKGAVTTEFTVLVPFFILLLVFFVDTSVTYLTHSEMFSVARDISRRIATGELKDEADVQAHAADHLFLGDRTYFISADFTGDKTVAIIVDLDGAAIFGYFLQKMLGRDLVAVASTTEEPRL